LVKNDEYSKWAAIAPRKGFTKSSDVLRFSRWLPHGLLGHREVVSEWSKAVIPAKPALEKSGGGNPESFNNTGFQVALRLPGTRDLKGYDKIGIATQSLEEEAGL